MTADRAWVGDLVADGTGRRAVVTDVKDDDTVWVLRPPTGGTTTAAQWETDDPDSLEVLARRGTWDSW